MVLEDTQMCFVKQNKNSHGRESFLSQDSSTSCVGFGWDRVNFLRSGWYGAEFWICAEHSDSNRDVFIIAEQGLHRAKAFSSFCIAMLVRRLGVHGRLG